MRREESPLGRLPPPLAAWVKKAPAPVKRKAKATANAKAKEPRTAYTMQFDDSSDSDVNNVVVAPAPVRVRAATRDHHLHNIHRSLPLQFDSDDDDDESQLQANGGGGISDDVRAVGSGSKRGSGSERPPEGPLFEASEVMLHASRQLPPAGREAPAFENAAEFGGDKHYLRREHPFWWDALVRFVAEGHVYLTRDEHSGVFKVHALQFSVSSVYDRACKPFPGDMIAAMAVSRNVKKVRDAVRRLPPKPSYLELVGAVGESVASRLHASDSGFMQLVASSDWCPDRAAGVLAKSFAEELGEKFGPLTASAVKRPWDIARDHGTAMHACVESYLNGAAFDARSVEMRRIWPQFVAAHPQFGRQFIHRTELSVIFKPLHMTGQVDMLYRSQSGNGKFILADLKVCKDMYGRKALAKDFAEAFPQFPATKCGVYELQLALYAFMLRKLGVDVEATYIIVLHVDHVGERLIQTKNRCREVDWLLEKHQERLIGIMQKMAAQ